MPPPALAPQHPGLLAGPTIKPPPAPSSGPQHAPLQPPAILRPPDRQQRRNPLGDSKSDVPQVSADLEGDVRNVKDPDPCKVSEFKDTTMRLTSPSKRRSVSSRKILLELSLRHAGGYTSSSEGSGSLVESEYSRSPAHADSRHAEYLLGSQGSDAGRRARRVSGRNSRRRGGRRSAICAGKADSKVQCYRCQSHRDLSHVCPNPPPSRVRKRKEIFCFECGKPGDIQINFQEIDTAF